MRSGGCLCGAVRFTLDGKLPPLVNCHCQYCRRAHGAPFVTIAWVSDQQFQLVQGEDELVRHASPAGYRCFCRNCGSRLFAGLEGSGWVSLAVNALDDPPERGPIMHLNVESKAPWYEITDDLPQHDSFPAEMRSAAEKKE